MSGMYCFDRIVPFPSNTCSPRPLDSPQPPVSLSQEQNMAIPINDRTARNRANASHSTGPKTEAGKHRSSLNAYRHGLTGHTIILPAEDLDAYQTLTQQFFDELKPVGLL